MNNPCRKYQEVWSLHWIHVQDTLMCVLTDSECNTLSALQAGRVLIITLPAIGWMRLCSSRLSRVAAHSIFGFSCVRLFPAATCHWEKKKKVNDHKSNTHWMFVSYRRYVHPASSSTEACIMSRHMLLWRVDPACRCRLWVYWVNYKWTVAVIKQVVQFVKVLNCPPSQILQM